MDDRPESVRLTRRRWDVYLLPLVVASIVLAIFTFAITSQPRFLLAPVLPFGLWLMMRLTTSKAGLEARTIKGTPGLVPLLWLGSALLAVTVALTVFDSCILGHGFREPLELYHLVLYGPPLVLFLIGVYLLERKYPRRPNNGES